MSMWSCINSLVPHYLTLGITHHTNKMMPSVTSINIGKYNIFHIVCQGKGLYVFENYSVIQNLEGLYSSYQYI